MTEEVADEHCESQPKRNWPEVREWMNVATAVAAVLLAAVSLWTTARVSGLEDYFQSEIQRRNTDLNELAARSRSLREQADRSTEGLSNLRVSADRIVAASTEAQNELIVAQSRLNDVRYEASEAGRQLSASQNHLASMDRELVSRGQQIDLYRRQRVYEAALFSFGAFREPQSRRGQSIGSNALADLRAFGLETRGGELDSYYETVRRDAPQICRFLEAYDPEIPPEREYPRGPQNHGQRQEVNGVASYTMSRRDYEAWTADLTRWNREFSEVSTFNRLRAENVNKVTLFVIDALRYCVCRALAIPGNGSQSVCSAVSRPLPPHLEALTPRS